jgi:mannitol 2-dehydrogenase
MLPVVPPTQNSKIGQYRELIARRFANPKIGDTIQRLCFDGSNRQPKFILPSVADRLKTGGSFHGLALVSALWCRYCYGETESGKPVAPNDPSWERLQAAARRARSDPRAFLGLRDIFGKLAEEPAYVSAFSSALSALWADGVRSTLADYLSMAAGG